MITAKYEPGTAEPGMEVLGLTPTSPRFTTMSPKIASKGELAHDPTFRGHLFFSPFSFSANHCIAKPSFQELKKLDYIPGFAE